MGRVFGQWPLALRIHGVAVLVVVVPLAILPLLPAAGGEVVGVLLGPLLLPLGLPWTPLSLSGVPILSDVFALGGPVLTLMAHAVLVRRSKRERLLSRSDASIPMTSLLASVQPGTAGAVPGPWRRRAGGAWWPWLLAAHAAVIVCSAVAVWLGHVTGSIVGADFNIILIDVGMSGLGLPWSIAMGPWSVPERFVPEYGPMGNVGLVMSYVWSYTPAVVNLLVHTAVFVWVRRRLTARQVAADDGQAVGDLG